MNVNSDTITLPYQHLLATGDAVRYFNGGGDSVSVGGLTSNTTYYVTVVDDYTVTLSQTPGGPVIDLNLDTTSGGTHVLQPGFRPAAVDDVDPTVIDLGQPHHWVDGQAVVYQSSGASPIAPLAHGTVYFVTKVDANKVRLSLSEGGAPITLDESVADGTAHFLVPVTTETFEEVAPTFEKWTLRVKNPINALDSNNDGRVGVDDDHVREITETAYLTDLSLLVLADNNADLFNGAGGLAKGYSTGAGLSLSVDTIRRETQAIIGNLELDLTRNLFSSVGAGIDSEDRVFLGYNHGFSDGDQVTYAGGGDTVIGGLRDGDTYFVKLGEDSDNSGDPYIRLGRSFAEHTATFSDADVEPAGNVIDVGYVHGFQLGDAVRYQAGGADPIGGLVEGQTYFVIPVSATEIALTEDEIETRTSFDVVFDPSDTVAGNSLVFSFEHEYAEGQPLLYGAGGGSPIPGLSDGATYYVHVVDVNTIELRSSALGVDPVLLGDPAGIGRTHTLQQGLSYSAGTVTGDNPSGASHTIDLGYWHGFGSGQPIRYQASGTPINGLTDDTVYYAIIDGEETIALAGTEADAYRGRWQYFNTEDSIESDLIELEFDHDYQTGDAVVYSRTAFYKEGEDLTTPVFYTDANNNSGELVEGEIYYAIRVEDVNDPIYNPETETFDPFSQGVKLALTPEDALNGVALTLDASTATGIHALHLKDVRIPIDASIADDSPQYFSREMRVDLTGAVSAGSTHSLRLSLDPTGTVDETHGLGRVITPTADAIGSIHPLVDVSASEITLAHSFATGDPLVYDDGFDGNLNTNAIGGLYRGQIVYAIVTGPNTFKLAESAAAALAGTALTLDTTQAVGTAHTFRATSIDSTGTIELGFQHGFTTGDAVAYSAGGGQSIGGLGHGNVYYVVVDSPTSIQLAKTPADANNGSTVSLSPYFASGSQHGFGRV
ncbi:MAG: hypothetical protein MI861_15980, partial [Pirellulales bacterium]|nr:hypothetical protein [Pirellulales bacterium]